MTEFEKWFESDEYVHDVNGVHFNVTAHVNLNNECDNRIELTDYKEFAEVCFNKGFDKGKNSHGCSLVNCSGRENGIQLRKAKTIIKKLCNCIRALNNPNTQLTDVNGFLKEFEEFTE